MFLTTLVSELDSICLKCTFRLRAWAPQHPHNFLVQILAKTGGGGRHPGFPICAEMLKFLWYRHKAFIKFCKIYLFVTPCGRGGTFLKMGSKVTLTLFYGMSCSVRVDWPLVQCAESSRGSAAPRCSPRSESSFPLCSHS